MGSKPALRLTIVRQQREAKPSPKDKSVNQPCALLMGKFPAFLSSEMVTDVGHLLPSASLPECFLSVPGKDCTVRSQSLSKPESSLKTSLP